ncbi:MAG: outer membrane beta-barrel protein [Polyangiaceae bacterium]
MFRTPFSKLVTASAFAFMSALGAEGVAHAQTPPATQGGQPLPTPPAAQPCPPGSWFCDGASAQGQSNLQPLPGTEQAPAQSANGVTYSGQAPAPPPVVIYQPAPQHATVVVVGEPPPYKYTPRPAEKRRSEWGLNLHLEGMPISGKDAAVDAGMGGLGFGVRYRPSPYAAIEPDLDFIGGKDYNGDKRGEAAFTLNCLIFVNPKSRVQVYFPIGFGWSWAHVDNSTSVAPVAEGYGYDSSYGGAKDYTYFGGQAGMGLEFRAAKHFALNFDVRGFVRGRVDHDASSPYTTDYEFTSSDGRHTNTSGGAIINAGMTFYF